MSQRCVRRNLLALLLALTLSGPSLRAEDAEQEPAGRDGGNEAAGDGGLRIGDQVYQPLEPLHPTTEADQVARKARAWFMTGKLYESRRDFSAALDAYQKAIEVDPKAVPVYRAMVPLAFALRRVDEAERLAKKALEIDPDEYRILQLLGRHMARSGKLEEAVAVLERAVGSKKLDRHSAAYVNLHRDLAVLHGASDDVQETADAYQVVFDALVNPDDYELDASEQKALETDPASSFERIADAFLAAKRTQKAIEVYEYAARVGKGSPGVLAFNLARVYHEIDKPKRALQELQPYFDAQQQAKGREAYELLQQILADLGREDELVSRLEAVFEKDQRNATLGYFLAERYVEAGELDQAEELYEDVLERSGDPAGYAGLVAVYRRQKQPEKLLDALSKVFRDPENAEGLEDELTAIAEDSDFLQRLLAVGRRRNEQGDGVGFGTAFLLGKAAAEGDRTDDAVYFYRLAVDKADRRRLAAVYNELGDHLLDADRHAEAARVFQEAAGNLALVDSKPNFLFRLSQAQELAGDTDAALKTVRQARNLLPDNPLLHYQEGWINYHARRWDDAIRLFEQVIAKYPQQQEIVRRCQFSLSNVYVQRGQQKKGEEILEKILADDPDDPSVNNDLGYLYADAGRNLEKAEKMIRKALAAEPENPAYLDSMGWVLYRLERYEEAVGHLEKAVNLPGGSDSTIWDHLGDVYQELGKSEKAVEAWQKALEVGEKESSPEKDRLEKIREKLKQARADS